MVKVWALLTLVFLFTGCGQPGNEALPTAPDVQVRHNDRNLYRYENHWRYKGRKFSGYIIQEQADGLVIHKLSIINGLANGLAVGFFENGHKMLEQVFVDDKPEGAYRQWWRNGRYKYNFFYKGDKYEGLQQVFFEGGQLREESNYNDGKPEGLQRVWNENGELISNYTIRNNKLYGIIKVESCLPGAKN